MNFVTALDFGPEKTTAVIAQRRQGQEFRVLGAGEAPSEGVKAGCVSHMGDVVESVYAALTAAERAAGVKAGRVYYNFDDPSIEILKTKGSKPLRGEGEIRPADTQDAREIAERLAGHFEKRIVYSKPTSYIIDDKDPVSDPVGVFGSKLEVEMRIFLASSSQIDQWQRVLRRAQVSASTPVLSAISTAMGIIPYEDRTPKRLVADIGGDFLNIFTFRNRMVGSYRILEVGRPEEAKRVAAKLVSELNEADPGAEQVLVTGDLSQDDAFLASIREAVTVPVHPAAPYGIPRLEIPRYAALAGLVRMADETERKSPAPQPDKGFISEAKANFAAFLNEYF